MKIRKILLATDFSACSCQAFAPAADLARRVGAFIELVNCMVHPLRHAPANALDARGSLDDLRRLHRRNLELEAGDPVFKGVPVTAYFLEGDGPETVLEYAMKSGTDLIVQASHGLTGMKRLFLGSFAERMLRLSPLPVLTFKSGEGADGMPSRAFRPQRIIFPYDFSAGADSATETVKFLAATYGARVLVLHAAKSPAQLLPLYCAEGIAVDVKPDSRSEEVHQQLTENLQEFAGRELGGLEHEEQVMTGDPGSVILERADEEHADLICMSTHGRTGLERIFLGSVAVKVLRLAPCPTWTVRTPASAQRGRRAG
jgi:nucleotide-binding universal stress UspA family protein